MGTEKLSTAISKIECGDYSGIKEFRECINNADTDVYLVMHKDYLPKLPPFSKPTQEEISSSQFNLVFRDTPLYYNVYSSEQRAANELERRIESKRDIIYPDDWESKKNRHSDKQINAAEQFDNNIARALGCTVIVPKADDYRIVPIPFFVLLKIKQNPYYTISDIAKDTKHNISDSFIRFDCHGNEQPGVLYYPNRQEIVVESENEFCLRFPLFLSSGNNDIFNVGDSVDCQISAENWKDRTGKGVNFLQIQNGVNIDITGNIIAQLKDYFVISGGSFCKKGYTDTYLTADVAIPIDCCKPALPDHIARLNEHKRILSEKKIQHTMLSEILKKIWVSNDIKAVEDLRTQFFSGSLTLYSKKQADFTYEPLFYHGEPILHIFSVEPDRYCMDLTQLTSLMKNNDEIGLEVKKVEQDADKYELAHIDIHIASGLIHKEWNNEVVLYPWVIPSSAIFTIKNGDIIEYTTVADGRTHCGEVVKVENETVFVKEYSGFRFSYLDCKYDHQDHYSSHLVCLSSNACAVINNDDYRIDEISHARAIRGMWDGDYSCCEEIRQWFTKKIDIERIYYIECENEKHSSECPLIYTVKELAEIEAVSRASRIVREITLPPKYCHDNAFLVPNTDEAAKQMGAEVSYHKEKWTVIEATINEFVSRFPSEDYKFIVSGLIDFSGDPVYDCYVIYTPETGMISTSYSDSDMRDDRLYPLVVNVGNTTVPKIGSIVEYTNCLNGVSVTAKVTSIQNCCVSVAAWDGTDFKKEVIHTYGQDDWTAIDKTYIPISACRIIPDIVLPTEQLKRVIRFEDNNMLLLSSPTSSFSVEEKIEFDINDIYFGLKRHTPSLTMMGRWLHFLSDDYILNIDPVIQKKAKRLSLLIEAARDENEMDYDAYYETYYDYIDDMLEYIEGLNYAKADGRYDDLYDDLY